MSAAPANNEPCTSQLWVAAEAGDADTVASLMSTGSTLHPSEWGDLSDFGNTDVLLAVLKGGFRPTDEQLGNSVVDATELAGSEEAALERTKFWIETIDSVLGESVSQAIAKRAGSSMCIGARNRCLKDGETNLDPSKPKPQLLALIESWVKKNGGSLTFP